MRNRGRGERRVGEAKQKRRRKKKQRDGTRTDDKSTEGEEKEMAEAAQGDRAGKRDKKRRGIEGRGEREDAHPLQPPPAVSIPASCNGGPGHQILTINSEAGYMLYQSGDSQSIFGPSESGNPRITVGVASARTLIAQVGPRRGNGAQTERKAVALIEGRDSCLF